jgi:hypothetical protein
MLASDFACGLDGIFLIAVFDNGMGVRSVLKGLPFSTRPPLYDWYCSCGTRLLQFCVYSDQSGMVVVWHKGLGSQNFNAHPQDRKVDSSTVRFSCQT